MTTKIIHPCIGWISLAEIPAPKEKGPDEVRVLNAMGHGGPMVVIEGGGGQNFIAGIVLEMGDMQGADFGFSPGCKVYYIDGCALKINDLHFLDARQVVAWEDAE